MSFKGFRGGGSGGGGGGSSHLFNVTQISFSDSPYTWTPSSDRNDLLSVDSSAGNVVIDLQSPSSTTGHVFRVKDASGDSLANPITVRCLSGNIDNGTTALVQNDFAAIILISDGSRYGIQ